MGKSEDNDARAEAERKKNAVPDTERILATLDTILARLDHQTSRIDEAGLTLSELGRGVQMRTELKELAEFVKRAVDNKDKHIADLNAAIQVIGKVSSPPVVNVNVREYDE